MIDEHRVSNVVCIAPALEEHLASIYPCLIKGRALTEKKYEMNIIYVLELVLIGISRKTSVCRMSLSIDSYFNNIVKATSSHQGARCSTLVSPCGGKHADGFVVS